MIRQNLGACRPIEKATRVAELEAGRRRKREANRKCKGRKPLAEANPNEVAKRLAQVAQGRRCHVIWSTSIEDSVNVVHALCLLSDGRLASGSADGIVRLWDAATATGTARPRVVSSPCACASRATRAVPRMTAPKS
jgi:hypothetical protein